MSNSRVYMPIFRAGVTIQKRTATRRNLPDRQDPARRLRNDTPDRQGPPGGRPASVHTEAVARLAFLFSLIVSIFYRSKAMLTITLPYFTSPTGELLRRFFSRTFGVEGV